MKEFRQDTNQEALREHVAPTTPNYLEVRTKNIRRERQGYKQRYPREPSSTAISKFYQTVPSAADRNRGKLQEKREKQTRTSRGRTQKQRGHMDKNLSYKVRDKKSQGAEVGAPAQPLQQRVQNSKTKTYPINIDSYYPYIPEIEKEATQNTQRPIKNQKNSKYSGDQTNYYSAAKQGVTSERKYNRKSTWSRGHHSSQTDRMFNDPQTDEVENPKRDPETELTARVNRDNQEALRDIRIYDQVQKMPTYLQKRLIRDGRAGVPRNFSFAKYCPPSPHNTTQYISYEYNRRLTHCPINSTVHSLMQDNIQLVPGEGIVMSTDDEPLSLSQDCHEGDQLSNCSASQSNATLSSSTCSVSAKTISFSALEQIGASMEGFISDDMFNDISLSDIEFKHQLSSDLECGNQSEAEKTLEESLRPQESEQPLLNASKQPYQGADDEGWATLHAKQGQPLRLDQDEETRQYMNMISLEQNLASNRHMIEQLERELQYKNSLIAEVEMEGSPADRCADQMVVL